MYGKILLVQFLEAGLGHVAVSVCQSSDPGFTQSITLFFYEDGVVFGLMFLVLMFQDDVLSINLPHDVRVLEQCLKAFLK